MNSETAEETSSGDATAAAVEETAATTIDTNSKPSSTTSLTTTTNDEKVKVHFVAVGSAPIMKKTKFLIGSQQRFSSVTTFLRKMLKLDNSGSSLFLYCNSAFAPGPDELVADLRDCFNIRGELVIHYALQVSSLGTHNAVVGGICHVGWDGMSNFVFVILHILGWSNFIYV